MFALFLAGCSSSKSKKTPLPKQVYHDITARNNAYFNAVEIFKTVEENIRNNREENYDTILPVYESRDAELAASYSADLDEVIKKASVDIQVHEPSKYTDNNYLLIGQTYYMKGDYATAIETFQFVNAEFKEDGKGKGSSKKKKKKKKKKSSSKKKKKKKKGKPMTGAQLEQLEEEQLEEKREEKDQAQEEGKKDPLHWMKHQPVRPDAMIWLVDSYTAMGKFKEAEAVLTIIDADEEFPAWLKRDLAKSRANMYISKGDFEKAIEPLTWLTEDIKKKRKKVRYNYILAQLYEQLGNNALAVDYYRKSLKGRPSYDMAFNAKMNIARISSRDNTLPSEDVIKLLTKMLKEKKNSEFFDQVYYALAELSLSAGNKDEGIDYLKKSIEVSAGNDKQKAKSYLKLAEIYFEDEEYVNAQAYYDSTLTLITADYNGYAEISSRNDILKNLVQQLDIIAENDSLMALYQLSDEEKQKLVDEIIQKKQEELERELEEKEEIASNDLFNNNNNKNGKNESESLGDWYYYNPSARSLGYNEFVQKWGKRPLEDNWRRSNKQTLLEKPEDEQEEEVTAEDETNFEDEREELLAGIAGGTEAEKAATDALIQAWYRLANIYRFDLLNYDKAIEAYETLVLKYKGSKYEAEALYNLYLLYEKKGVTAKADIFKEKLLRDYPNSKMAMILKDPNYLEASNQLRDEITGHYKATFELYQQNRLAEAMQQIEAADSLYETGNFLKPKYDLLEAFVIGKTQDLGSYKEALEEIVANYPTDEVKTKAEEILAFIETTTDSTLMMQNNMLRYEYNKESRHFVMLAYKDQTIKLSDLTVKIAQYNDANHSLEDLKIDPLVMPDGHYMLLIKSFDNLGKGKKYYDALKASAPTLFKDYEEGAIGVYMISDVNFNKVIINKELGTYLEYFNIKYIQ